MNGSPDPSSTHLSTRPQVYRSKAGDSIQLDCLVENLGQTVITWYKGQRIVSAGDLQILHDPRLSLVKDPRGRGVSVRIDKVDMTDQGQYTCEVNFKDKPLRITHRLEVLGEFRTMQ